MSSKPIFAVGGIGMIILGSYLVLRILWLGGAEIIIGIVALVALAARPKSAQYAGIVLGIATLLTWLAAVAMGVVGWISWLTFMCILAFVFGALTAHRASVSR
jgi:hypothetical protein